MRLVRARQLLGGQDWYDFTIPNLGHGTLLPWSRFADMPLFFTAKFFGFFVDAPRALELAALWVPLFLAALLIPLARAMARPFVPKAQSFWAAVFLFSCVSPFLFQFSPTRVDHHAIFLLLSGAVFALLARMILLPRAFAPPVLAALGCSFLLWVGAESFPFIILFAAALAGIAAWCGGPLLRSASLFGIFFGLFTAAILPLALPVLAWAGHELLWFSGAYVLFALLVGASFVFGERLARYCPDRSSRMAVFVLSAMLMAALFFALVPEASQGVLADFEPWSAALILGRVSESVPLKDVFARQAGSVKGLLLFFAPLFVPLAATGAGLFAVRKKTRRAKLVSLALFFVTAFLLLSFFGQRRFYPYVQLFSAPLVGWLFVRLGGGKSTKTILVAVFLLFLPSVFLPWAVLGRPLYPDLAFFYAARTTKACDATKAAVFLADPDGYGKRPRVIANMMNEGPALLYFTPHRVLSAPYNVETNADMLDFFGDREGATARKIAAKNKIDLVLLCRHVPRAYVGLDRAGEGKRPVMVVGKDGRLYAQSDPRGPTLIENLVRQAPPKWLSPVKGFEDKEFFLYERIEEKPASGYSPTRQTNGRAR